MARFKIDKDRVEIKNKSYSVRIAKTIYVQLPKSQLTEVSNGKMNVKYYTGTEENKECYIFSLNQWLFNKLEDDLKNLREHYKLINR